MAWKVDNESEIRDWLNKHTISCALGRITKRQCESNRARPTIAEYTRGGGIPQSWGNRGGARDMFRPTACEQCTQWEEAERPDGGDMAKIVKCSVCGEDKPHLARGMCKQCYWKSDEYKAKVTERKARKAPGAMPEGPETVKDLKPGTARKKKHESAPGGGGPNAEGHILRIDFTGCPDVLNIIERLAANLDRTPEGQARFILRRAVRAGRTATRSATGSSS